MIKAIIFDCFGVLTVDLWKEFVGSLPKNVRNSASELNHAYDAGHISYPEFISQVRELTGKTPREPETTEDKSSVMKNVDLLDYIVELSKHFKIGLLSNVASNWIRDVLLTDDEQKLFDCMVMSFEVGMTKPDHDMFLLIAQKLGVEPSQAIMIDDVQTYCEAAQAVGMHAIPYTDFKSMKNQLEALVEQKI